ncbi:hypothetical protein D3C72_2338450 [compost metagenome]
MAFDQQLTNALAEQHRVGTGAEHHVNLGQPGAIEQALRPVDRDIGDVVDVETEQLALFFHHPDHPETRAADAHQLAQRVGFAE